MSPTRFSSSSSSRGVWPWAVAFLGFIAVAALVLIVQSRRGGGDSPSSPPAASTDREIEPAARERADAEAPPIWQPSKPYAERSASSSPSRIIAEEEEAQGPAIIRGRLVDVRKRGVAGVDIDLWDSEGGFEDSTETDGNGEFEFEIEDVLEAGFTVCVDASGGLETDGEPANHDHFRHPNDLAPGDDPVECVLELLPAARLVGFVLLEGTREPVEGADIEVTSGLAAWDGDYVDTLSRHDGGYELTITDFPSERVYVSVVDDEDRALYLGPISYAAGKTHTVDLLIREPWNLSGIIRDRATGHPIEDAEVTWLAHASMHDPDVETAATDEYGEWELEEVPPGKGGIALAVRAQDYSPAVVRVTDPDAAIVIDLDIPTRASGIVTAGSDLTPIAAARVTFVLRHPDGRRTEVTESKTTDSTGGFELTLEEVPVNACDVLVEINGQVVLDGPLERFTPSEPSPGSFVPLALHVH